mgnify:CR=1 FL=1
MFRYLNVNPLSLTESDCVTRAISLATGYSYAEIQDKLYYISQLLECEKLCVCCYQHLLSDVFKYDKVYCYNMTVSEFAQQHPEGVYLIRMEGHLSTLVNGVIYDLWDCSYETLTDVWRVERRVE